MARCFLGVDVDPKRIQKRLESGYCDRMRMDLTRRWQMLAEAREERRALSVGLVGNVADVLPELIRRDVVLTCSPTRPARTIRCMATCRTA